MDIIDIMLARAMTPQGQTETYVAIANAAAAKAEKAQEDAEAAIATVTAAAEDIADTQAAATQLLEDAQEALETAQQAQINMLDTEDVDAEIKKMVVNANVVDGVNAKTLQVVTTYPDNSLNTQNLTKMYKVTGSNEDGTMTQKAITDALATKADASTAATKAYVDSAVASIPSSGSTINMNSEDAGHLVTIDSNGNLVASTLTDEVLINALVNSNSYNGSGTIGLDIDYANRTFVRVQDAIGKTMGSDFNMYTMYGGRTRCNVADDGTINAFYGDNDYTEDGSNGQVMVYQPKFYYKRVIQTAEQLNRGQIIRHEVLILSDTEKTGFKLAPIFGDNLEYVLLPAYDASIANDKLASIAGVKPANYMTAAQAETYALARGTGWHIMNLAAESANQMLEMIEFGTMNGQSALGDGITYAAQNANNCRYLTGSTASLGNTSGQATETQVDINGTISTMSTGGYRAISYRGMENPWGNLWSMVGGVNITGDGASGGGIPYICTNYDYTPGTNGSNYESLGFNIPGSYGWINAMGYGNDKYDWVYMPIECSSSANSLLPVGDTVWPSYNLNGINTLVIGGSYGFKEECGPFQYGADRPLNDTSRVNYGAKLLYIPQKNEIYTANIAKWTTHMGG